MAKKDSEQGVERVSTGIKGLDKLVEGGIPKESVTLVSGGPGTGKTLLCCQFLYAGLKNGEGAVYLTLEQQPEDVIRDAKTLGFDFSEYQKQGKFRIEFVNPAQGSSFLHKIEYLIEEVKADRIVLDSISVMGMYSDSPARIRERLYSIIKKLRQTGSTSLMTAEIPDRDKEAVSRYDVEEFVADGVVVLHYTGLGEGSYRSIEVRKMRRTNHKPGSFSLSIKKGEGISVQSTSI